MRIITISCILYFILGLAQVDPSVATPHELTASVSSSLAVSDVSAIGSSFEDKNSPLFSGRGGAAVDVMKTNNDAIILSTKTAILWGCLLSLNSGYINGVCLSGILSDTKQAAAAVTGAWTLSALGFASGNQQQFRFNQKCIGSYIGGSCLASLFNPNPVPFQINKSKVSSVFMVASLLVYSSSSIAKKSGNKTYIYLAILACGMQNSITSVLTSNLVRSTHFSGISSDIGTFLGQTLRGNIVNLPKLKSFLGLASSFWLGTFASFFMTEAYGSSSLLVSSVLFMAIAVGLLVL